MKQNHVNFEGGTRVDKAFDLVLLAKTLFATFEVIGGIAMFFVTPSRLNRVILWLTRGELHEDSHDLIARLLINFGQHFTTSAQILAAIYLLAHGLIKLITLLLLWKKILWAYPFSMAVFTGFIIYQIWDFTHTHSVFLILVTLLDILMIVLTILEYREIRHSVSADRE
ncbi:MAG: DUF2127 domain-containing protein [Streptococcaceae bacterium]|jgi:uncharacterized membrane protein|nr:DUF2127 domain-containing protein [Streptococcaceae bacterium]